MLNILTQYKTVRDRYFPGEQIHSTFWNPLDSYGVTLSNRNYSALVNSGGSADSTRPHAGWDNLELTTGKWYWEVRIETCTATGTLPHLSFGLRNRLDGMAIRLSNPTFSGAYEDRELRYNSDGGGSIDTTTQGDVAVWHSNQGSAPEPVHDFVEVAGNYFAVTTTGVSGFSSGDVLMFALDRDAGNFWLGKNGTWFNSGDPAAGTNPQFTNMDCSEAQYGGVEVPWRFFFATTGIDYSSTPLAFHLATGNELFPQIYSAPSGFTALVEPASTDTRGNVWNYRDSSGDFMSISTGMNACWSAGGAIATGAVQNYALSVGQFFLEGKYYWEMNAGVNFGNNQAFGAALLSNPGTGLTTDGIVCLWKQDGTLHDGVASITMTTTGVTAWGISDVLMFAIDLDAGKMWIGLNGTWFNSGDPAAGTNPQFSGLPLTGIWCAKGVIISGPNDAILGGSGTGNGAHVYAAPSGFTDGIPLVVEFVP